MWLVVITGLLNVGEGLTVQHTVRDVYVTSYQQTLTHHTVHRLTTNGQVLVNFDV
jgi:hypothetical protein